MLSPDQIARFKADGTLVLPGFIPQSQLEEWQRLFWQSTRASPSDPASWPGEGHVAPGAVPVNWGIPGVYLSDWEPMDRVVEQLLGPGMARKGLRPPNPKFGETQANKETDNLQVTWPQPAGTAWEPPAGGHIEGGSGMKDGWKGGFMLGAITYLEDVQPSGGGFYYWPRSHLAAHSFFKSRPECINPNAHPHPFNDSESLDRHAPTGYSGQPREWTAKAGDTILWHYWTMHNGSMNLSPTPRLGLFARWYHRDYESMKHDMGGIRSDGDLWKHWGPEVQRIGLNAKQAHAKL